MLFWRKKYGQLRKLSPENQCIVLPVISSHADETPSVLPLTEELIT